jgi:hypothetical protein
MISAGNRNPLYDADPDSTTTPPREDQQTRRSSQTRDALLNLTTPRHRLARKIFFGQRGELRQHYREGMEDQLGALGLALNCVVLFNSLYIDAAVKQLAADGFPVTDEQLARLSPLQYDHINCLGRYAFTRPAAPGLRQLRDPHTDDEDDDGEQD